MLELNKIHNMDSIDGLKPLPKECVDTCVTSPPYWGLRDYGVKGQIGLEESPDAYVSKLVMLFNEVKRVLKSEGTLWLNLGDSYAASSNTGGTKSIQGTAKRVGAMTSKKHDIPEGCKPKDLIGIPWRVAFALQGFKLMSVDEVSTLNEAIDLLNDSQNEQNQMIGRDLLSQWRISNKFWESLRDSGWYLRSDVIWAKSNPMPESVVDRPTRSHEYIFLLSKSKKYYYDAEAIKEPLAKSSIDRINQPNFANQTGGEKDYGEDSNRSMRKTLENFKKKQDDLNTKHQNPLYGGGGSGLHDAEAPYLTRSKRDVWNVSCHPYKGAHFAVYPEKLIEPCILAGSSGKGCCPACGKPWVRVTENKSIERYELPVGDPNYRPARYEGKYSKIKTPLGTGMRYHASIHHGWESTCGCGLEPIPSVVLDPFMGSGTTAVVSIKNDRNFIGYDLNTEYVKLANRRIYDTCEKLLKEMG